MTKYLTALFSAFAFVFFTQTANAQELSGDKVYTDMVPVDWHKWTVVAEPMHPAFTPSPISNVEVAVDGLLGKGGESWIHGTITVENVKINDPYGVLYIFDTNAISNFARPPGMDPTNCDESLPKNLICYFYAFAGSPDANGMQVIKFTSQIFLAQNIGQYTALEVVYQGETAEVRKKYDVVLVQQIDFETVITGTKDLQTLSFTKQETNTVTGTFQLVYQVLATGYDDVKILPEGAGWACAHGICLQTSQAYTNTAPPPLNFGITYGAKHVGKNTVKLSVVSQVIVASGLIYPDSNSLNNYANFSMVEIGYGSTFLPAVMR